MEFGRDFFVLSGDGNGHFGAPLSVGVGGNITALVTGSLHRADVGSDIVIGVEGAMGSMVAVYDSASGGLRAAPATHAVGQRITGLTIGDFDGDSYRDVAVVAGNRLMVLHGDEPSQLENANHLEMLPLPFGVSAVAAGNFAGDGRSTQMAVLTQDRGVVVLSRPESPHSYAESRAAGGAARMGTARPGGQEPWRPDRSRTWAVAGNAQLTDANRGSTKLLAARVSGSRRDDLLIAGAGSSRVTMLSAGILRSDVGAGITQMRSVAALDSDGDVVAVLTMRLNVMGAPGLVMLTARDLAPVTFTSQAGVTYHVTTLSDSQTGTCTTPAGTPASSNCSTLRAAVLAANANAGQDLVVFDKNGAITLSVPGQDDTAQAGDLDVTDSLTIVGNGASNTIIQGGTSGSSGIDKVFSFNPLGLKPGFAVSISGMTVQFGRNTFADFTVGNDAGGAFDFDAGAQDGAGSLSVSNCNILGNSTLNGDGGGIALFNGGTVSISDTTIAGNTANTQDPNAWYGFYGGGIFVADPGIFAASISIANSTISGNTLSATNMKAPIQFGGGICSFAPAVALHATTISGNQANGDGGGLYGPFGTFTVDQGSLVSGNVSGGYGGGVFGVSVVNASTFTNNRAASGGGALYSGGSSTVGNSRIAGNNSTRGAQAVGGDSTMGASVAATHNWWGSNNSPASLVAPGIVTYSPWLTMTLAASPASIYTQGTSVLTARIATGSDGSTGYQIADGTPVGFAGSPGGVSPASSVTTSGAAVSTYTAGTAAGSASVNATLDSQTLTASINVRVSPVPTLTGINPAVGVQGMGATVTLTGANFVAGATVLVSNPGITVSGVTAVSATQITATLAVATSASLGAANVAVTTGGGTSNALVFTVNATAATLTVSAPASLAGSYQVGAASFGPVLTGAGITAEVMPVVDTAPNSGLACTALSALNAAAVNGKIAIVDRGTCNFTVKVKNCQDAGAVAVVVVDNVAGSPPAPVGGTDATITIPAVRLSLDDGNTLKTALVNRTRTHSGMFATLEVNALVPGGAEALNRGRVEPRDDVGGQ